MDTAPGSDPGEVESDASDEVGPDVYGQATVPVDDDGAEAHDPLRFNNWMKRSTAGAVLSGIALGLQHALEPKRELPAFVMEAPGDPEDPDAPITLHFDPDDPTKTVAVIRPQRPAGNGDPSDGNGAGG